MGVVKILRNYVVRIVRHFVPPSDTEKIVEFIINYYFAEKEKYFNYNIVSRIVKKRIVVESYKNSLPVIKGKN